MSYVAFRFDVDSHVCLDTGVPRLLELADDLGVHFTFFVHMGRATARHRAVRDLVGRRTTADGHRIAELSVRRKLGTRHLLHLGLVNPKVGATRPDRVRAIVDRGHEVGLHGGRNHRTWQDQGAGWGEERVRAEVGWALAELTKLGVPEPMGFSSPAWQGSPALERVLASMGFAYVADLHGHRCVAIERDGPLPRVPTALVGEPGGVGYLEWLRACGSSDRGAIADLRRRLDGLDAVAVVYDHPFWAGVHDLRLLAKLIEAARDIGRDVVTVRQTLDAEAPETAESRRVGR